jgi:short-subunit dehydrogenase
MVRDLGSIDLLVTSAGVGTMDFLDRMDPQEGIVQQIDTNLTGTILLAREVLPSMMVRRSGTIILVGSLAGLVAMPTYSIYAATKFGLKGFAEALRREVRIWGIRVALFLPGTVDTTLAAESVAKRRTGLRTPRVLVLTAAEAGEAIAALAERPRSTLILPRKIRPAIWLARTWPKFVDWIVERVFVRGERGDEIGSAVVGRVSGKRP